MSDLIERLRQRAAAYPEGVFGEVTDADRHNHGNVVQRSAAQMGRHMAPLLLEAAASLEAAREDAWQPIETAPSDCRARLYFCRGKVLQGFMDATGVLTVQHEFGWRRMRRHPSHWRPLPAPPAIDQARGKGGGDERG